MNIFRNYRQWRVNRAFKNAILRYLNCSLNQLNTMKPYFSDYTNAENEGIRNAIDFLHSVRLQEKRHHVTVDKYCTLIAKYDLEVEAVKYKNTIISSLQDTIRLKDRQIEYLKNPKG